MKNIRIGQKEIIHFIGIGGIGMSGLAQVMKTMGFKIQGSDQNRNKNTSNCIKSGIKGIKLEKANDLTFDSPDNDLFPCLNLAYQAFSMGMASTIILNAANEVAVDAFLKKIIPFTEIPTLINSALQSWAPNKPSNIEDVLAIDSEMRIKTMSLIANR